MRVWSADEYNTLCFSTVQTADSEYEKIRGVGKELDCIWGVKQVKCPGKVNIYELLKISYKEDLIMFN